MVVWFVILENADTIVFEHIGHSNPASIALHKPWSNFPIKRFFADNPVGAISDMDCSRMQHPPNPRKNEVQIKRIQSLKFDFVRILTPFVNSITPESRMEADIGMILDSLAIMIWVTKENNRIYVQTSIAVLPPCVTDSVNVFH